MKRLLVLASLIGLSVPLAFASSISRANATMTDLPNTSSNWATMSGDAVATDVDNGVKIGALEGNGKGMYYTEKVPLDGLTFKFKNTSGPDCPGIGFFFSNSIDYSTPICMFNLWHQPWGANAPEQARFGIVQGISANLNATNYTTESFAESGFHLASTLVLHNSNYNEKYSYDGVSVKFEKISKTAWKLTITELIGGAIWTNQANYSNGSCFTFLKHSDVSSFIDLEGKAYLHVYSSENAGKKNFAEVLDLKADIKEDVVISKEEVSNAVNAIKDEDINAFIIKKSLRENLLDKKAAALEFLKTAPEQGHLSDFKTALDFVELWENRYQEYGYQTGTTSVQPGLPWVSYVSNNGAQKTQSGETQISFWTTYGARLYNTNEYDATNFSINLNVGLMPTAKALPITLNMPDYATEYVNQADYKYFHIEIYHCGVDKYLIVVGNNANHNESISGYGIEGENSYTGRYLTTTSGDIMIKVTTDYETNKTTFDVNNGDIHYVFEDNKVLYRNENPKGKVPIKFNMGIMGGTPEYNQVLISKIMSPDVKDKSFTKGSGLDTFLFYDLDGETRTSLTIDDVELPNNAFLDDGVMQITLYAKYLDTLSTGKHVIKLTSQNVTMTWDLTVNGNDTLDCPWSRKGAVYVKRANITDLVYPINCYGQAASDLIIKLDGQTFDSANYEFTEFNTIFTIKANAISTWSDGLHLVTLGVNGFEQVLTLKITIL